MQLSAAHATHLITQSNTQRFPHHPSTLTDVLVVNPDTSEKLADYLPANTLFILGSTNKDIYKATQKNLGGRLKEIKEYLDTAPNGDLLVEQSKNSYHIIQGFFFHNNLLDSEYLELIKKLPNNIKVLTISRPRSRNDHSTSDTHKLIHALTYHPKLNLEELNLNFYEQTPPSKEELQLIGESFPNLKTFQLRPFEAQEPSIILSLCSKMPKLSRLELQGNSLLAQIIVPQPAQSTKDTELHQSEATHPCEHLTHLSLSSTDFTDEEIRNLILNMPHLKEVHLNRNPNLSSKTFQALAEVNGNIEILDLNEDKSLKRDDLDSIPVHFPNLKQLAIAEIPSLELEAFLNQLTQGKFTKLKRLDLGYSQSDKTFEQFTNFLKSDSANLGQVTLLTVHVNASKTAATFRRIEFIHQEFREKFPTARLIML